MSDKTGIEWTDATWNPVTGCTKVSAGCAHCYAETFAERWRGTPGHYFENGFDVQLRPGKLDQPLRWSKPRRIFVNSMSDLFHDDVPDEFIAAVFAVMHASPQHKFQVLTKRPDRMRRWATKPEYAAGLGDYVRSEEGRNALRGFFNDVARYDGPRSRDVRRDPWMLVFNAAAVGYSDWPLPNVMLGVSVEDQRAADERIPILLETPAAVRFLSCEPLLDEVRLDAVMDGSWWDREGADWYDALRGHAYWSDPADGGLGGGPRVDWVICGGESGPKARPMNKDWARSLRDQCTAAGVPFFFKQWGEWSPDHGSKMVRVGKKRAGRRLDGKLWNEFPGGRRAMTTTNEPRILSRRVTDGRHGHELVEHEGGDFSHTLRIILPGEHLTQNQLQRRYGVRKAKRWASDRLGIALMGLRGVPSARVRLRIHSYRFNRADYDGLVGGGKYLVDGLVDRELLVDDSPEWIVGKPEYQQSVDRKMRRTEITIEYFRKETP